MNNSILRIKFVLKEYKKTKYFFDNEILFMSLMNKFLKSPEKMSELLRNFEVENKFKFCAINATKIIYSKYERK